MSTPELSAETTALIARYRVDARADLARQRRLGLQYALGAGLIAVAAVVLNLAWLALAVWAVFVIWLVLRLRASTAHAASVARAFDELQGPGPD